MDGTALQMVALIAGMVALRTIVAELAITTLVTLAAWVMALMEPAPAMMETTVQTRATTMLVVTLSLLRLVLIGASWARMASASRMVRIVLQLSVVTMGMAGGIAMMLVIINVEGQPLLWTDVVLAAVGTTCTSNMISQTRLASLMRTIMDGAVSPCIHG